MVGSTWVGCSGLSEGERGRKPIDLGVMRRRLAGIDLGNSAAFALANLYQYRNRLARMAYSQAQA